MGVGDEVYIGISEKVISVIYFSMGLLDSHEVTETTLEVYRC